MEYKLKQRKVLFSLRKNFNDWAFGVALVGVLLMILDRELIMSQVGKAPGVDIEFSSLSLTLRLVRLGFVRLFPAISACVCVCGFVFVMLFFSTRL